ncbi:hypothetical protein WAK64_15785 [Bacillus spongiae]|uniref:Cytochrome c oxidase subunit 4 n=1 Tax=Bacillus spongiae TaxID=2683610 RepID=A0ABU8HGK4_9BACI
MYGLLNLGSLVLGLIAWTLPISLLTREKKYENRHWVTLSFISISACSISLCLQIFYIYHKVTVEDWGALMDTMYAVAFASAFLLIVTIILNVMTFYVTQDKKVKQ